MLCARVAVAFFYCSYRCVWLCKWIDEQRCANILPKFPFPIVCSILALLLLLLLSCFALYIDLPSMSLECKVKTRATEKQQHRHGMLLSKCLDDNRGIVLQFSEIPSNQIMALNFWRGICARQFKNPPHTPFKPTTLLREKERDFFLFNMFQHLTLHFANINHTCWSAQNEIFDNDFP